MTPKTHAHAYRLYAQGHIGAFGRLALPTNISLDGYTVHPTTIDASFHLGASLSHFKSEEHQGKRGLNRKRTSTINIPTNVGVYSTGIGLASHTNCWANVAGLQQQSDDLVLSSYKLGQCNDTCKTDIMHMLAKPLQTMITKASAPDVITPSAHFMYELHWKAIETTPSPRHRRNIGTQVIWQKLSTEGPCLWEASLGKRTSMYTCAMKSLQIVRQILGEQATEGGHCQLLGIIDCCCLGVPSGTLKADVIVATDLSFLRSAAQEQPKIVWQATMDNTLNTSIGVPLPRGDAFGVQRMGSLTLQAQLLPTFQAPVLHGTESISRQALLIIGGLGDIGMLVGLWANASMAAHISIASRLGRPSIEANAIVSSMHYTSICRCDIACVEEASYIVSEQVMMLRNIFHAGKLAF